MLKCDRILRLRKERNHTKKPTPQRTNILTENQLSNKKATAQNKANRKIGFVHRNDMYKWLVLWRIYHIYDYIKTFWLKHKGVSYIHVSFSPVWNQGKLHLIGGLYDILWMADLEQNTTGF